MMPKPIGRIVLLGMLAAAFSLPPLYAAEKNSSEEPPLRIVVIDPLCDRLACDCVGGYAQRKYDRLGEFLQQQLGRDVKIAYAEALSLPQARIREGVDLVIGKFSEVTFDAGKAGLKVRTIAMLTGLEGKATQTGLFVVRNVDPARSIEDLAGNRLLIGPEESDETHSAAAAALKRSICRFPRSSPPARVAARPPWP